MKFATRLNSFRTRPELYWKDLSGKPTNAQLLQRVATVKGLTHVDLNYPDHLSEHSPQQMRALLADLGLELNGFAVRYYSDPTFRQGAFTHPDAAIRRKAIDIAKRGIDAMLECGGKIMTIWPGQDGFEYPFQSDYRQLWELELDGIRQMAEYNKEVTISIEYKPNEPRTHAILGNAGMTMLAIRELGLANLGMTLDFCHVLYAGEQPANIAALVKHHSRLVGIHLNDGYARYDDELVTGSVHFMQTIELLLQMRRDGYEGVYYFDTMPDTVDIDPVAETELNIEVVNGMMRIVDQLLATPELERAAQAQDAIAAQRIVHRAVFSAR